MSIQLNITDFAELRFTPPADKYDNYRAKVHYDNNYGASGIRGPYSYGEVDGLYELAVLYDGALCYDTPITSDVEGYLTPDDVTNLLHRIAELPAKHPTGVVY
jgi:hypothetical protein